MAVDTQQELEQRATEIVQSSASESRIKLSIALFKGCPELIDRLPPDLANQLRRTIG